MSTFFKSLNFDRNGLERVLGELEAAIMEELWCCEEACVRDIHQRLNHRQLAYTTVMTVMGRLAGKGLLAKKMKNKAYYYSPAMTKEELYRAMVDQVSHSLRDLALPALANFVDHLPIDANTLDELEDMIAAKRSQMEAGD